MYYVAIAYYRLKPIPEFFVSNPLDTILRMELRSSEGEYVDEFYNRNPWDRRTWMEQECGNKYREWKGKYSLRALIHVTSLSCSTESHQLPLKELGDVVEVIKPEKYYSNLVAKNVDFKEYAYEHCVEVLQKRLSAKGVDCAAIRAPELEKNFNSQVQAFFHVQKMLSLLP